MSCTQCLVFWNILGLRHYKSNVSRESSVQWGDLGEGILTAPEQCLPCVWNHSILQAIISFVSVAWRAPIPLPVIPFLSGGTVLN